MKRIIYIIVIFSLTLFTTVIFSCGEQSGESNIEQSASEREIQNIQETTAEERITDDLPNTDFGGRVFKFLSNDNGSWEEWDRLTVETETGEAINDAMIQRNRAVEERFNVKIEENRVVRDTIPAELQKSVRAGDRNYNAAYVFGIYCPGLAADGYLYDLYKLPNIDFSKAYWDQNAKTQLTMGNKLYMMTGDANIFYYVNIFTVLFNKKLLADYNIPDPYKIVKDGKWTIDKMLELGKDCPADLNGDGVVDFEDRFGLATQSNAIGGLIFAAGEWLVTKNSNDLPEFQGTNARTMSVLQKIYELTSNTQFTYNITKPGNKGDTRTIFADDRALFTMNGFAEVKLLREEEVNFGLLPVPKYEDAQKDYYHWVAWSHSALVVPSDIDAANDGGFIGTILEAMHSESRYRLRTAFFDITLNGKFFRDEESTDMLEIILNSCFYPMIGLRDFGNLLGALQEKLVAGSNDFTSIIEAREMAAQKDIEKFIEQLEKLD